jgi:putative ABC transport system permease protein
MAIPFSYNLRNLVVRKTTTIMTALGIGLTVAVLLTILALVHGLRLALEATGDPLNIIVLRKGSETELVSNFARTQYQDVKFKPGIASDSNGQPLASLEVVTVINLVSVDAPDGINVTVRGVSPQGVELRKDLGIVEGRWFDTGKREVAVGQSIAKRFPGAHLGGTLHFGSGDWQIVGIMSSGQSATNSEIFADVNQLAADFHRSQVLSSSLLRATDAAAAEALIRDLNSDQRLNVNAVAEKDYYEHQQQSGAPIEFLGMFVSVIMAVGSAFAAMNTMYAAVARRSAEIGTLRVLGFSRASILLSFVTESVLLSAIGGLIGCALALSLNGMTTGIGNFATFAETDFSIRLSPGIMIGGVLFAMLLGVLGGLFPAAAAARKEVVAALRGA